MTQHAAHKPVRAAAAAAAYPRRRHKRDAVRAAYRVWTATTACGELLAIEAYQSEHVHQANEARPASWF
jgi:hypothetical protein